MGRAGGVPHHERPIGIGQPQSPQVVDGLGGQIGVEVVSLLGRSRRLDIGLVANELGGPLIGLPVEEPVVVVEPDAGWPGVIRPGGPLVAGS